VLLKNELTGASMFLGRSIPNKFLKIDTEKRKRSFTGNKSIKMLPDPSIGQI
jgi:hypothetical protein